MARAKTPRDLENVIKGVQKEIGIIDDANNKITNVKRSINKALPFTTKLKDSLFVAHNRGQYVPDFSKIVDISNKQIKQNKKVQETLGAHKDKVGKFKERMKGKQYNPADVDIQLSGRLSSREELEHIRAVRKTKTAERELLEQSRTPSGALNAALRGKIVGAMNKRALQQELTKARGADLDKTKGKEQSVRSKLIDKVNTTTSEDILRDTQALQGLKRKLEPESRAVRKHAKTSSGAFNTLLKGQVSGAMAKYVRHSDEAQKLKAREDYAQAQIDNRKAVIKSSRSMRPSERPRHIRFKQGIGEKEDEDLGGAIAANPRAEVGDIGESLPPLLSEIIPYKDPESGPVPADKRQPTRQSEKERVLKARVREGLARTRTIDAIRSEEVEGVRIPIGLRGSVLTYDLDNFPELTPEERMLIMRGRERARREQ